jgi:hypothetical protein
MQVRHDTHLELNCTALLRNRVDAPDGSPWSFGLRRADRLTVRRASTTGSVPAVLRDNSRVS